MDPSADPATAPAGPAPAFPAPHPPPAQPAPPPRKRPRSASPPPVVLSAGADADAEAAAAAQQRGKGATPPKSVLTRQLSSADPIDVVGALNVLLRLTSDDRLNFSLGEGGELVVDALVKVFDDAVAWGEGGEEFDRSASDEGAADLDPTEDSWANAAVGHEGGRGGGLAPAGLTWAEHCALALSQPNPSHAAPGVRVGEAEYAVLHAVVLVVRNLSFVAANGRFLVHSLGMLRVLSGCLYFRAFQRSDEDDRGRQGGANNSNVCLHALHALMNLAAQLDCTGRRIFSDMVLLDPNWIAPEEEEEEEGEGEGGGGVQSSKRRRKARAPSRGGSQGRIRSQADVALAEADLAKSVLPKAGYGLASVLGFGGLKIAKNFDIRDETLSRVPDDVVRTLVAPHVRSVLALFPALRYCLGVSNNRAVVVAAMELMGELIDQPENHAIFLCTPDAILDRLVDLLSVPRLGPESFEYVDPVRNTVSRVSALKIRVGYDQVIDSEMRDRSIELLIKLTGLSPDLKRRLGRGRVRSAGARRGGGTGGDLSPATAAKQTQLINSRLYDALVAMLASRTGRHDAPHLAGRLLANLAVAPENRVGMMYVEGRVIDAAGKEPGVANVVCNGVLNHIH